METKQSGDTSDKKDHSACTGQLCALSQAEVAKRLIAIPDWELQDGRLNRTFRFDDFGKSMKFVDLLGQAAESMNHHPNFCVINKRNVSVAIWTHKLDCLTSLDFDLAESANGIHDDLMGLTR